MRPNLKPVPVPERPNREAESERLEYDREAARERVRLATRRGDRATTGAHDLTHRPIGLWLRGRL